jgi:hypothetical protein
LATSSLTDLFATIAGEAERESPVWGGSLRPDGERDAEPVFSTLCDGRFALGLETIYEGYLLHYGRPRLFAPPDDDTALLLGDYLYAHGLVRIAETGDVEAVAVLAELISECAALRADGRSGDGEAWVRAATRLCGPEPPTAAAPGRALALHDSRLG